MAHRSAQTPVGAVTKGHHQGMGAQVMVFSPAPQLTVTIEQQADQPELHVHPGGQGVWQARMIRSLGVDVTFRCAAGVAAVLARGGSLHDAVRTGAAAGALNVTRHGLGTGHVDAITVLAERVELRSVATIKERS